MYINTLLKSNIHTPTYDGFEKPERWFAKIGAELITHVSLELSERVLHEEQNHLFQTSQSVLKS